MLRAHEYSAEPGCKLLVAGQVVLSQSANAEELSVRERDKRERQAVGVQVRTKLGVASLERLIAQNVAVVLKRLLRKRRDEVRMMR